MVRLLAIFILLRLFRCQCTLKAGAYYSYDIGTKCLDDYPIKPSSEEGKQYLSIITEYLSYYAFRDIQLNLPGQYESNSFNILKNLDLISKKPYSKNYNFTTDIQKQMNKLKDAHTHWTPPCLSTLSAVLPYAFSLEANSSDEHANITTRIFATTEAYSDSNEKIPKGLKGYEVTHIDLTGQKNFDKAAWEVIAEWADTDDYIIRSPAGALNDALLHHFFHRPLALFPYPESENISIKVRKDKSSATEEYQLPWLFTSSVKVNKFEDLCPLRLNSKSNDEGDEVSTLSSSVSEELQSLFSDFKEKRSKRNTRSTFSSASSSSPESALFSSLLQQHSSKLLQKSSETVPEYLLHRMPLEENSSSGSSSLRSNPITASDNFIPLNDTENLYAGYWTDEDAGLLTLPTFSISTTQEQKKWASNILQVLSEFKKQKKSKLIIDVFGNPGGVTTLSDCLLRVLFPSTFPVYYPARVANSTVAQQFFNKPFVFTEPGKPDDEIEDIFSNLSYVTVRKGDDSLSRYWSKFFSLNFDKSDPFYPAMKQTDYFKKHWYNPEDIIVLTDGWCVSACAMFTKALSHKHLAKIIGRGPRWHNQTVYDNDIATAGGGNVLSSDAVEEMKSFYDAALSRLQTEDPTVYSQVADSALSFLASFPKKFPRASEMTFTLGAWRTFDDNEKWLEYTVYTPDSTLASYPTPTETYNNDEHLKVVKSVIPYFDKCFSWNVKVNETCTAQYKDHPQTPGQKYVQHMLYGNPCAEDGTKYDLEKCVEAYCEEGYYKSGNGVCTKVPEPGWFDLFEFLSSVPVGVWIAIAVVIVLALVAVGIFLIYYNRKKKSQQSKSSELNEPLYK